MSRLTAPTATWIGARRTEAQLLLKVPRVLVGRVQPVVERRLRRGPPASAPDEAHRPAGRVSDDRARLHERPAARLPRLQRDREGHRHAGLSEAGFLGIKTINIFPGNGALRPARPACHHVLYDAHRRAAGADGRRRTPRPTARSCRLALGACSSRAAMRGGCWCWAPAASRACCPRPMQAMRPIEEVTVWNTAPRAPRRSPRNGARKAGPVHAAALVPEGLERRRAAGRHHQFRYAWPPRAAGGRRMVSRRVRTST